MSDEFERLLLDDNEAGPWLRLMSPKHNKRIPIHATRVIVNSICIPVVIILLFVKYAFPTRICLPFIFTFYVIFSVKRKSTDCIRMAC